MKSGTSKTLRKQSKRVEDSSRPTVKILWNGRWYDAKEEGNDPTGKLYRFTIDKALTIIPLEEISARVREVGEPRKCSQELSMSSSSSDQPSQPLTKVLQVQQQDDMPPAIPKSPIRENPLPTAVWLALALGAGNDPSNERADLASDVQRPASGSSVEARFPEHSAEEELHPAHMGIAPLLTRPTGVRLALSAGNGPSSVFKPAELLFRIRDLQSGIALGRSETLRQPTGQRLLTVDSKLKPTSRVHAQISAALDGDEAISIWLEDLKSLNGTYINGDKLEPHVKAELKPGDVFCLGSPSCVAYISYTSTFSQFVHP